MIAAMIIVFREVLEAALIIGIVLVATKGMRGSWRMVVTGVLLGLLGAGLVAGFAGRIADAMEGYGQEIFNAAVLLFAVVMLVWHNAWMSIHGRAMAQEMKGVGEAVRSGHRPLHVLTLVIGLAVLREGAETVLFLYGLITSDGGMADAIVGGSLGFALGALVGAVLYLGLMRIPTRHLFSVTSWMISLLAAGMAAQAMTYLSAADVINLGSVLWDSSALLDQNGVVGKVLHTLIGYIDRPTTIQLVAYVSTLAIIFIAPKIAKQQAVRV